MSPEIKKRLLRTFIMCVIAAVIGAGMAIKQIKTETAQVVKKQSSTVKGSDIGGPYTLQDQTGKTVTEKDFANSYKLIYFGFTYCPAICPTELQKISKTMGLLGDKAAEIQPIFITIDPERDTVDAMREYVKMFHPRLVGLTGSTAQITDTLKKYRIYAQKVQTEDATDYTMDHSSLIYLMNKQDKLISIYRAEDTAEFIADDVRANLQSE